MFLGKLLKNFADFARVAYKLVSYSKKNTCIRKVLNLGLKAEKPLQNENHTDDWALGSHPLDNGHVTR